MAAVVELTGISKRFGGTQALAGVDLTIERGTVHAIVGENGAGKSTLGKVIAGVIQPDSGEYILAGRAVALSSPRQALEVGVTMMAQELSLVPARSAWKMCSSESRISQVPSSAGRNSIGALRHSSRTPASASLPRRSWVRYR